MKLTLAESDSKQISQEASNSPNTCRLAYRQNNVYMFVQAILPIGWSKKIHLTKHVLHNLFFCCVCVSNNISAKL